MESEKDRISDPGDGEDIPSDFFDDFNRDDFMEGLSVIDSWDEEDGAGKRREPRRINVEALDSVKDLRELIGDNKEEQGNTDKPFQPFVKFDDRFKWRKRESPEQESSSSSRMNDFIKPGSRRDPSKTNEAIKKDKEVKVKEYLAKHLESTDDIRPPGTELDDYFEGGKTKEIKKTPKRVLEEGPDEQHRPVQYRGSPHYHSPRRQGPHHRASPRRYSPRKRYSPTWSPRPHYHPHPSHLHQYRPRFSPHKFYRKRNSPPRRSPQRRSPPRRSPPRRSPPRRSPHRRYSPHRSHERSPRRRRLSRSPQRRSYDSKRARSRSRSPHQKDTFLYPNEPGMSAYPVEPYSNKPAQLYTAPVQSEFPGSVAGYTYPQGVAYGGGFPAPYNYNLAPGAPSGMPEPVPVPTINPIPDPLNVAPAPAMVPAPALPVIEQKTPYDALAQLVAEGKISQEDYFKLAPNKGATSMMDSKTLSGVMSRCNQALVKLEKLLLPNHLMMNNHIVGSEPKALESKFCSPLKRQASIEFNFTKTNGSVLAQQNQQLVESIITTIGLDKVVSRYKKKLPKDVKDAAVQTTKPFCDVCEIRESTSFQEASTSTEPEYFSSSVHTQVVEQDLVSSKSVFNPTGSISDGAPISIAHLTPAQLVSQLAARAKTLQQPSPVPQPMHPNQYGRRNPNYDYDGRGGGSQQQYHHNYNNYRY